MREDTLGPRVAAGAKLASLSHAEVRTLRMGLVSWQRDLMRAPALLATPGGLEEWERIGLLLDILR
ncbi:hypothetical protein [Sulfobacillus harzensis]|uniref:Uncharacterized protein n=1 Tax=Sulfobacillus harzensis TaxID=2729629 RepID=A0A7Y0L6T6_9FIRM|nr:hypothetical protein [Sulfobacillus harzensis]NMP23801.1 hypothetical protein [Sulfobacillus harzensis]